MGDPSGDRALDLANNYKVSIACLCVLVRGEGLLKGREAKTFLPDPKIVIEPKRRGRTTE